MFVLLKGSAIGGSHLPPDTFPNLPIGVMQGNDFRDLSMSVKDFIAMHPQDAVKYEQVMPMDMQALHYRQTDAPES